MYVRMCRGGGTSLMPFATCLLPGRCYRYRQVVHKEAKLKGAVWRRDLNTAAESIKSAKVKLLFY